MTGRGRGSPWTSTLATTDGTALTASGFVPVGFVTAVSVWSVGFQWGQGVRSKVGRRPPGFSRLYPCTHTGSGRQHPGPGAGQGAYGGVQGRLNTVDGHEPGLNWEHIRFQEAFSSAFESARTRLSGSIRARQAHGAIGVKVTQTRLEGPGQLLELSLSGTAVRLPGSAPLESPFATTLSAGDLLKLLPAGWVPSGIVMGAAAVEAEPGCGVRLAEAAMVASLHQYADAIDQARVLAAGTMEQSATGLGEAVVAVQLTEHLRPERHSYGAEVTVLGTAARRFSAPADSRERPMQILRIG